MYSCSAGSAGSNMNLGAMLNNMNSTNKVFNNQRPYSTSANLTNPGLIGSSQNYMSLGSNCAPSCNLLGRPNFNSANSYMYNTTMPNSLNYNMGQPSYNMGPLGSNMGQPSYNMGPLGSNMGSPGSNMGSFGSNMGSPGSNMGSFGSNMGPVGSNMAAGVTLDGGSWQIIQYTQGMQLCVAGSGTGPCAPQCLTVIDGRLGMTGATGASMWQYINNYWCVANTNTCLVYDTNGNLVVQTGFNPKTVKSGQPYVNSRWSILTGT